MLCVTPDNINVLIYSDCKIRIRTSFASIQDAKFGSISNTDAERIRDREIVKILDSTDAGNDLAIIDTKNSSLKLVKVKSIKLLESKDAYSKFHCISYEKTGMLFNLVGALGAKNQIFTVPSLKGMVPDEDLLQLERTQIKNVTPVAKKGNAKGRVIKGSLSRYGKMRRENQEAALIREEEWLERLRNNKLWSGPINPEK